MADIFHSCIALLLKLGCVTVLGLMNQLSLEALHCSTVVRHKINSKMVFKQQCEHYRTASNKQMTVKIITDCLFKSCHIDTHKKNNNQYCCYHK